MVMANQKLWKNRKERKEWARRVAEPLGLNFRVAASVASVAVKGKNAKGLATRPESRAYALCETSGVFRKHPEHRASAACGHLC